MYVKGYLQKYQHIVLSLHSMMYLFFPLMYLAQAMQWTIFLLNLKRICFLLTQGPTTELGKVRHLIITCERGDWDLMFIEKQQLLFGKYFERMLDTKEVTCIFVDK